ncbi:hypothetical protein ACWEN3_31885 [Streptomyces sp. NPDC004561]
MCGRRGRRTGRVRGGGGPGLGVGRGVVGRPFGAAVALDADHGVSRRCAQRLAVALVADLVGSG